MDYCHQHNLVDPDTADTFSVLLGDDWERVHWYATELERDRAHDDMARRHEYSRDSDLPTQILEKIHR
jgi:hypothetical protein